MERICGKCSLCCRILGIDALGKTAGEWCRHCVIGQGCGIYGERPAPCRDFECLYKTNPALPEVWHPAVSHLMLRMERGTRLMVFVDPARPGAWTREPYRRQLQRLAASLYPRQCQVMVRIGDRHIAILPDREVDLGICQGQFAIKCTPHYTPRGMRWEVTVVRV
jgi:hypothetical protein